MKPAIAALALLLLAPPARAGGDETPTPGPAAARGHDVVPGVPGPGAVGPPKGEIRGRSAALVPEPATLELIGIAGLLACATAFARRRLRRA